MKYKAFLFDLNGTMIDDMPYHVKAWHTIVTGLGSDITFERMKDECYGKNSELLERIFPERFSEQEKNQLGFAKEKRYQEEFKPHLKLFPGLSEFLEKSYQDGIKMAIGSAAIMYNIDFVLDGLNIRHYFDAIVSADDVEFSKPHPETYLKGARQLGIEPEKCLVFEDNPKGVEAAENAGMDSFVITSIHSIEEFPDSQRIIGYSDDYLNIFNNSAI